MNIIKCPLKILLILLKIKKDTIVIAEVKYLKIQLT